MNSQMLQGLTGINSDLVQEFTKDCPRQDCRIASHGAATTLMNICTEYDRNGNVIPQQIANRVSWNFSCSVCGKNGAVVR